MNSYCRNLLFTQNIIQKCGLRFDPKEYALFRSRCAEEKGDEDSARIWLDIAMTVDYFKTPRVEGKFH